MNDEIIKFINKITDCYELYDIRKEDQRVITLTKKFIDLTVWHGRTAHLNHRNVLKMRELVKEMKELKTSSPEKICEYCMMSRQQIEISRSLMTRVTKLLELLHLNLKDSLFTIWIENYTYFLLIKDDFFFLIFVYSLKLKNEAYHKFVKFKALMKR